MDTVRVSSRALNPLSRDDDPSTTFCCKTQAKATTATKLFRDDEMLNGLKRVVLPKYLEKRIKRGLDIWSAGCSSGEEAYSLACLGLYILRRTSDYPKLTVFGTDISTDQLRKCKVGRYLYGSSASTVKKYKNILLPFASVDNGVIQMSDVIRSHVKFGKFDLRKRPKKHVFDYITCNHVFQYYDDDAQADFVGNFLSVLKPGGVLFIEGLSSGAYKKSNIKQIYGYKNLYESDN